MSGQLRLAVFCKLLWRVVCFGIDLLGIFHSRIVVDFEDVVESNDSRMVELFVNVVLAQRVSARKERKKI